MGSRWAHCFGAATLGPGFHGVIQNRIRISSTLSIFWNEVDADPKHCSMGVRGHHGGMPGVRRGDPPCTNVPLWSIWNTLLAHSLGSMGASVETSTGNSGSCTVTLSFTTRLPAWRDTICSLSFPLLYKSDTAGGKALSTWPGRGNSHWLESSLRQHL